ncbi:MAG: glucose-1-phosphate cytidylyltransferase, partial [Candidatus Sericytochromatia bacterium]|nr:glucose-1-phosphate cytidylyltransferase [Candidatus Tanganyikabacteria bacterium]
MKVVILAGGLGTRLSEETVVKPKPMVEIGGIPIICHIMGVFSAFGHNEFGIALGYKGEAIKDYFLNFYQRNNDLTIDLSTGQTKTHRKRTVDWSVALSDTGLKTQTGGRIKRMTSFI